MPEIDVAERHGVNRPATDNAIEEARHTGHVLYFRSGQVFDWMDRERQPEDRRAYVDFTGVSRVEAAGARMVNGHLLVHQPGNILWVGGEVDQADDTYRGALIILAGDNTRICQLMARPTSGQAFTVWQIGKYGDQAAPTHVRVTDCQGLRPSDGRYGRDGFGVYCGGDIRVDGHKQAGGRDDGYVVKAVGAPTKDVHFSNCTVEDHATICSIGSQCYFPIENVSWTNMTGHRVGHAIYFKPGERPDSGERGKAAPGSYVRKIRISGVDVDDEDGEIMATPLTFIAHTDMFLEDVKVSDVHVRGRFRRESRRFHSFWDADASSTIRNIDLESIKYTDPYGGADNGPSAPGYPLDRITNKRHQGVLDDITYRGMRVDGKSDAPMMRFEDVGQIGDIWMVDPLITNRQGSMRPLWDVRRGRFHLRELPD